MTKQLNRRIFLRGLGGACVAAPFLSTLGAARSVGAQAAAAPKRLIMMFTHYGCLTTKFFPKLSHGALTAADLDATTLKPLSPFADKLLLPRGIRSMNEWTSNMKRGQGNDPHTQVAGSALTCQPVTPNSDDPFSFDSATKFNAKPIGPSLDHVIAKQLSPDGTPLFIRVGNANDSPQSGISYSAKTTAYPGLGTPTQVYSALTGLFTSGQPMNMDTYASLRGKSVIDLVKTDLETLERQDMSMEDKNKLEMWKALLSDTGGVVATAQCSEETATAIGATKMNADAVKTTLGQDVLMQKITDSLDGADVYMNVAALAAICNANPMILLKFPGSYMFRGMGFDIDAHSLSHRLSDANMTGPCVDGVLGMLKQIDDYYCAKFAHLVGMLNMVGEGDGKTVLDNSAAVWLNEMSDGNAHNLNNLPIVQAGSMGGYFKQGWSVNVDTSSGKTGATDLSLGNSESQCANGGQANGINQGTGTDSSVANGPINKYFCNLMNGLGVKAGADGFPAMGGTAEVTKYGMYDKTEDFIHGGTAPANISNPGEYTALRPG